jgi:hypothetical protein
MGKKNMGNTHPAVQTMQQGNIIAQHIIKATIYIIP